MLKRKLTELSILFCLLSSSVVFAQTRGVGVRVKGANGQPKEVKLYEGSYALVIGESNYTNGWDALAGVASDVIAVKQILESVGFKVETAENLTSRDFEARIKQFIDDYGYQANNRILIYYAGHGHTLKSSGDGRELGYVVPVDAPKPAKDEMGFRRKAISMDLVQTYAKQIQSKHAMFIFDSCFSGKLVSRNEIVIPPIIEESVAYPVRQFITAGAANQPVPDESIFRRSFVRGLEGEADRNRDGYITGTELADFLKEKVTNYSNRAQTPQYGKINDVELDKGDFVFVVGKDQSASTTKPQDENPQDAVAYVNRGNANFDQKNYSLAIIDYTKAIQINPNLGDAYSNRGVAYSKQGNYSLAIADYTRAIQINPQDAESYKDRGNAHYWQKNYNLAIDDYNRAIQIDFNLGDAYSNRGLAYSKQGNYSLAIADYTRAIHLSPENDGAYRGRGTANYGQGNYSLAIADYTKAIQLNPQDAVSYYSRGTAHYQQGNFSLAIADCTKAIQINPQLATAYINRGVVHDSQGNYSLAIADYAKAIQLNPEIADAYYNRATTYYKQGNYSLAVDDYTKAIQINPQDAKVYKDRGLAYCFLRQISLANADNKKAVELGVGVQECR